MTTRLDEIKERLAETERKCGDLLLEADCDLAYCVARIEKLTRALNFIANNASSWGLEAEEYVTRAREALAEVEKE